ncbi:hypothetical protein RvY_17315 [Ramazzottius varieornatus]|uniref:Dynactin subunit 2 n=1 Tax=Ramazzottius varieornatus TaxID=947166 RepID=A0A1D1W5L9_RAMVA|nr:hypothetical protein RvY_17315 [Ramazzottius varieornatus]
MASKFAGLPGFAHGEPDFYESVGANENFNQMPDIVYDISHSQNENIERTSINAKDSYGAFRGKALSSALANFSGSVGSRRATGYSAELNEYEAVGEGLADETLQERYERIQGEIRALESDFALLSRQQKRDESFIPQTSTNFTQMVEELKSHLASINVSSADTPKRKDGEKAESGGGDASRNDTSGLDELSQAVILEQRIRKLEQCFGSEKELSELAGDSSGSLMATVTLLKNQMSLLDKDNLDHIESRMQAFLPRLNQAIEKKSHAKDSEMDKKVSEAYALLKRWEESMNTLPAVVDRLVALREIHQQSSKFVQLQKEVMELQQELLAKVGIMEGNIRLSEESFAQNMNYIKKNVEMLEARLKGQK